MINSTEKVISHKVGLLNLAEELQNVSQSCKVMGFSGDIFYRYKEAVEEDGGYRALTMQGTWMYAREITR